MAPSLAQIIPQASPPEPKTGMCEESIKQRDPKASPLCQLGFQTQVGKGCSSAPWWGERVSQEDSSPSGMTCCWLFLPRSLAAAPPPPGTFKYSQGQQPLTDACAHLAKPSPGQAGVNRPTIRLSRLSSSHNPCTLNCRSLGSLYPEPLTLRTRANSSGWHHMITPNSSTTGKTEAQVER